MEMPDKKISLKFFLLLLFNKVLKVSSTEHHLSVHGKKTCKYSEVIEVSEDIFVEEGDGAEISSEEKSKD